MFRFCRPIVEGRKSVVWQENGEGVLMHILIIGDIGVGKSTLIRRILANVEGQVYGFRTIKLGMDVEAGADAGIGITRGSDSSDTRAVQGAVYMHPAVHPGKDTDVYNEANMIAFPQAQGMGMTPKPEIFDALGVSLLSAIPSGAVVLMDEIGYLESTATRFCDKVMGVLNGPYHVIAAVKTRDTPFLQQVRDYPNALKYVIDTENRDALYERISTDLARVAPDSPFLP